MRPHHNAATPLTEFFPTTNYFGKSQINLGKSQMHSRKSQKYRFAIGYLLAPTRKTTQNLNAL